MTGTYRGLPRGMTGKHHTEETKAKQRATWARKRLDGEVTTYRVLFLEHRPPPWLCTGCGNSVATADLIVHHVNGDHSDNRISNLVPMHAGCHTSLHQAGRETPDEVRERIAVTMKTRGVEPSAAARQAGNAAACTPEAIEKKIATFKAKKREKCPGCNMKTLPGPLALHRRSTGH